MCRAQAGLEAEGSANVQSRELLPANVVPTHYDISLKPNFKTLTFDGTVVIDLDVTEASKSISLHTLELDIHSVKISAGERVIRQASYQILRSTRADPQQLLSQSFV